MEIIQNSPLLIYFIEEPGSLFGGNLIPRKLFWLEPVFLDTVAMYSQPALLLHKALRGNYVERYKFKFL